MTDVLYKAREYEALHMKYADEERPKLHVTGGIGWINDPNGFSVYKGEYHLFFQYHPYDTAWGPMHWGHVKTKDFIRWERLPIALAPDTPSDSFGCFSGSALELPDGRQLLVYTGVNQVQKEDGKKVEYQHQCIAVGDGIDYKKYEGNPVIDIHQLPENHNILDFRDPKVWLENDTFYMVVGNRTEDGSGAVLLYESRDFTKWEYKGIVDRSFNEYGKMWECPDYFALDGRQVLLVSPQEMVPLGLEFHAGFGAVALLGQLVNNDYAQFQRENVQAVDYGIDFYAPQTLLTSDGRRVMIAWMQNWTTANCVSQEAHIIGQMTLPRELTIRNDRLIQNPVRELENYRGRRVAYKNVVVCQETNLAGVSGRLLDMTVTIKQKKVQNFEWFKIYLAKDGIHCAVIRWKPSVQTIRIDRTKSGGRYDIVHVRNFIAEPKNDEMKLRIIIDTNSVELFVNDGEQAATFLLYSPVSAQDISFEANGTAVIDVEKYELCMD